MRRRPTDTQPRAVSWRGILLIAGLAALISFSVSSARDWRRYLEATHLVEHTYQDLVASEDLRTSIDVAEGSQREYLLMGEDRYLEPYDTALPQVGANQLRLKELTADDPGQQVRLVELRKAIAEKLFELQDAIELRRDNHLEEALLIARMDHSGRAMSEIRRVTASVQEAEYRLLTERSAEAEAQILRTRRLGGLGVCLIVLFLIMATVAVERDATRRQRDQWLLRKSEEQTRFLNDSLEVRVAQRTEELASSNQQLQLANRELEAFAYSVSHDLRAPLRSVDSFSQIVLDEYADKLDEEGTKYLRRIRAGVKTMSQLINDLLDLARWSGADLNRQTVELSDMAQRVMDECRDREPERIVHAEISPDLQASCDPTLLRIVLHNLLGNAWKFTGKRENACVAFGAEARPGQTVYFIRDNGAGFDMAYASRLFAPFQRLHGAAEFEGTGIGLATVQRIVHRHGGSIWAEAAVEKGATFYFTLAGGQCPKVNSVQVGLGQE